MDRNALYTLIKQRQSFLCVGLDPDPLLMPHEYARPERVYDFLRQIIDATAGLCVAYKPNLAFFECLGHPGMMLYEKVLAHIPHDHFVIADAKRGDIGNTSLKYAESFFGPGAGAGVDAVTVSPYMGVDSVKPFLSYPGKWAIVLALTSNEGAENFQLQRLASGELLYEKVIIETAKWGHADQLMFVAGATRPEMLASIRALVPEHFLLVPGIGAQGGSLADVCRYGMNSRCGILVNSGRSVLYASRDGNFKEASRQAALKIQEQMASLLEPLD